MEAGSAGGGSLSPPRPGETVVVAVVVGEATAHEQICRGLSLTAFVAEDAARLRRLHPPDHSPLPRPSRASPTSRCSESAIRCLTGDGPSPSADGPCRPTPKDVMFDAYSFEDPGTPSARPKLGGITTSSVVSSLIDDFPSPSNAESIPPRKMSRTFSTPA